MKLNVMGVEPLSRDFLEPLKALELRLELRDPHHGAFEAFAKLLSRRKGVRVVVLEPRT